MGGRGFSSWGHNESSIVLTALEARRISASNLFFARISTSEADIPSKGRYIFRRKMDSPSAAQANSGEPNIGAFTKGSIELSLVSKTQYLLMRRSGPRFITFSKMEGRK